MSRPQITGRQYPASPLFIEDALVLAIQGYTQNEQLITPKKDVNDKYILGAPAVWPSSIPGFMAGFDPDNPPANFPGIIIQMSSGTISAHEACVSVKIMVGIFDPNLSKQGFRVVHNVLYKIVNGFWYDSLIGGVFSLDFTKETHWELFQKDDMDFHPFYFGHIEQSFLVLKPQAKDFDSKYTVDVPQADTDWNLLPLPSDI
jgi:hypothetical protein